MAKSTSAQWTLESQNGIESLKFAHVPVHTVLGDHEVLVELRAASLNYRDIVIAKVLYLLSSAYFTLLEFPSKAQSISRPKFIIRHIKP